MFRVLLIGQTRSEFILPTPLDRVDAERQVKFFKSLGIHAELQPA